MTSIHDSGHIGKTGMDPKSVQRPDKTRQTRESEGTPQTAQPSAPQRQVSDLHEDASLRNTVADLIDNGDLNASSDGKVREGRVEQARRNTEQGAYDDYRVLSDVVDRLLNQWDI
ncbi:MAG: hypothetical protein GF341_02375 [candidate division Zixibacteria bacterium]|nr:hypothetical protein [candidate division Zixibacteria bacterium]